MIRYGAVILFTLSIAYLIAIPARAQEVITEQPDTVRSSNPLPAYEEDSVQNAEIIILNDTVPPGPVYEHMENRSIDEVGLISLRPNKKIPGRASLLSAVMPGLGQVYNGKYWKVPVIYGGFAMFGYLINYNNENYQEFRAALFAEIDGDDSTVNPFEGVLSEASLRRRTDLFRRNRDFSMILAGVWYLLNIVEAHVDAHLQEFDVSEDISMRFEPVGGNNGIMFAGVGLTIILDK
ncbi:DUF5683 domain-containing protein [Roseivirga sp. BDSF3-8]|uniref:DUF5683 domain-containing protein n=1 Tax=Roseivirga sp. BDSF3-8 TaxID=3241598 RepID=UPI003531B538